MRTDETDWIDEAVRELGLDVERLEGEVAARIFDHARAVFVSGNPRVWWLSLSQPYTAQPTGDLRFVDVVPSSDRRLWFVPEDGSESPTIYRVMAAQIDAIRENCPFFEYNAVDEDFRWMVTETDHDMFILSRAKARRLWIFDEDDSPQRYPLRRLLMLLQAAVNESVCQVERAAGYGAGIQILAEKADQTRATAITISELAELASGRDEWFYDITIVFPISGARLGIHDSAAMFVEAGEPILDLVRRAFVNADFM